MNAAYLCPVITLFQEDGSLDLESQGKLYDNLIDNGIDGILVGGSCGEFYAMTMEQRMEQVRFAVEKIAHRVTLIVGTGSMVFDEIITFSKSCLDLGVDGVMILPPYYFSFGQEDLFQYYGRLAEQIDGDIYIYNFPGNTGCSLDAETILRLASAHPNIVGLKDTIPGMVHTREVINVVKAKFPAFRVYSGYDENLAHNILAGGDGCIASLSNLAPERCAAWVRAFRENDADGIRHGQEAMGRLMDLYAIRPIFQPVLKEACRMRGIVSGTASTFPKPPVTEAEQAKLLELFRREGL